MKKKNIGLIAGVVLLVVLCVVYFVLHTHNANSSESDRTGTAAPWSARRNAAGSVCAAQDRLQ